ncbi:MAG TPA: DUF433 domain-containing protein [Isosphaeraceae bacterium]|jgi:uncharacterized protein (DUF433 family)
MEPTTAPTQDPTPPQTAPVPGELPVIKEHIGIRPGYCGGKPHILGHRIKVKHVAVWHERMEMSPAQIVETYPTITLADVHAALAYYYDHRDEIEAEIAEEDRAFDELKAKQPSILETIRRRKADAPDDPLPSR